LGDIYKNTSGLIIGNMMYINGEGVLGFILSTFMIYWFVNQFKRIESLGENFPS
jgi:hypothetical protein